ncbi:MAG: class I SAM-dependent methyltransferase [Bacteroidia bacterium]|nr:class I SAM-dependent methyltransferase [Bacteroidia bacterium]MDG2041591.1 class I SAM-dependent methyltransferase [Bacteroidia bacterium]
MIDTTPYSKIRITLKYLRYYLSSKGKHGVHSPLVYQFITQVLNSNEGSKYPLAEYERKRLQSDTTLIDFVDFGKSGKTYEKKINTIAKSSLKSKKYAQLLRRIAQHFQLNKILELGTSLGITTAYLAYDQSVNITTLEGSERVAQEAEKVWKNLRLSQIQCIKGGFEKTLSHVSQQSFDLIYLDGNHRYEPTLAYFDVLKKNSHKKTVFIFDDIHYSESMEEAWRQIKQQADVTITIDLFFIGIVWIDNSLSKEDFVLRY